MHVMMPQTGIVPRNTTAHGACAACTTGPRRLNHPPLELAFADDAVEEVGGDVVVPGARRSIVDLCVGATPANMQTPHLAAATGL